MKTKKPIIFYVSLLASVIIHGFFFIMISLKTAQNGDFGYEKEPEHYLSLFNISFQEPPQLEKQFVLSAPADFYNTVSDEALAENFIVIEEFSHITEMVSEIVTGTEKRSEAAAHTAEYVKRNYIYIQRRIGEKLVYPSQARKAGIQGVTELGFTIHEDGSVSGVTVRASSGYTILDEAAMAAVFAAVPFPKPHSPARIAIPVSFKLR